jgi:hypothetical protein
VTDGRRLYLSKEAQVPDLKERVGPLLEGMTYTFVCTDDTEYRGILLDIDERGVTIEYRGATVFIAAHELADVS